MLNKELWLKRIRNLACFLGMILPWISLIGAVIVSFATGVPAAAGATMYVPLSSLEKVVDYNSKGLGYNDYSDN